MWFALRIAVGILVCLSGNAWAQSPGQKLTVTGKLVRVMAIGAESTGWAIQMNPAVRLGDKQVSSVQVRYRDASKLEKLENKQVKATGKLVQRQGVETGTQPLVDISSIKEVKTAADTSTTQPNTH
jgi:hypothetical protein